MLPWYSTLRNILFPPVYGRELWTGPFFATDPRYGYFPTPGNVEVVVDGADASRRRINRKVIANCEDPLNTGRRSVDTVSDEDLLAVWSAQSGKWIDAAADQHARTVARERGVPHLVYYDGDGYPLQGLLRTGDWAGIMAYPLSKDEKPKDTLRRVENIVSGVKFHKVALIRPLYTRSGEWSVDQVMDLQAGLVRIINRRPNIVADLWFAWGRPSGIVDHPEFEGVAEVLGSWVR